ncbi:protein phosphatase 1, regulatory subunit 3Da [Diretmus argenteus]
MESGWCIGRVRIPPQQASGVSRPCVTIDLNEMLRADKPDAEKKKPVPIRPPGPRVSPPKQQDVHRGLSCEAMPKPIIRRRSRSLPSSRESKKQPRNFRVRFVDSLGLDLEDVRLFKTADDPFVPQHVTFKLLMAAELAGEGHLEISLPYLKPVFTQQPGDRPEFLTRLCRERVCLERVSCYELGVVGITQVLNLHFEKEVRARYSFTEWKSCTDTKASWVTTTVTKPWDGGGGGGGGGGQLSCDTFRFHLPVPPFLQPGAVLEFAIQYKVCGAEYWDNNDGQNYKLVCHNYKLTVPKECEDSMVHFI